ncbi:MAG: cytochrome [Frankiales bacterium]|nr:cytochrome [Frankiales bacterium]
MVTAVTSRYGQQMETCPHLTHADLPMATDRGAGWTTARDAGPVVTVDGTPWITAADDVRHVLRNPEIFSSKGALGALGSVIPLVPIAFDAPEHGRYRRMLQPLFGPKKLADMLPSLQSQITDLVDALAPAGSCDLVEALAVPYPSQVFLTLFGLPLEDRDRLLAWKDAVIQLGTTVPGGPEPDMTPALELFAYLSDYIQRKRAEPGDDLLSETLHGDDPLTDEEAIGMSFLFVLAGLDTVTASLGFAFQRLAQDPDLRRKVVADPALIPAFVEEIVRLEPPAPMVPRIPLVDVEIGGQHIPAGTIILASLGAANREDLGDDLDLAKGDGRHLGFGGGPHRCLGSHLARLELKLVLEEWHRRIPEYALVSDEPARIPWPAGTFGLTSLPVTWASAASPA